MQNILAVNTYLQRVDYILIILFPPVSSVGMSIANCEYILCYYGMVHYGMSYVKSEDDMMT
jgi:hypothetical protein